MSMHDHVGAVLEGEVDRRLPVLRLGDHGEPLVGQAGPEAFTDQRVVVGQQQAQRHWFLLEGFVYLGFRPRGPRTLRGRNRDRPDWGRRRRERGSSARVAGPGSAAPAVHAARVMAGPAPSSVAPFS